MRINNNIMALNTHRQYNIANSGSASAAEKLSSGYRINRAGDDAAGLAISEKMRAQIKGLNMASKNSQDAVSLVQTAEGALQESHNILQRMRELSVQSSSDTNDVGVDRAALDEEFQALKSEINNISEITHFNGKKLLDGTFGPTSTNTIETGTPATLPAAITSFTSNFNALGTYTIAMTAGTASTAATMTLTASGGSTETFTATFTGFPTDAAALTAGSSVTFTGSNGSSLTINFAAGTQAAAVTAANAKAITVTAVSPVIQTGANEGETLSISIGKMDATELGIGTAAISSQTAASAAITSVNTAINAVSTQRSKLGAIQNRLNHKIANLDTSAENLSAAESRIRDIDMAKEMTNFTKQNILSQAATAMLAQANSAPQNVLQLLR